MKNRFKQKPFRKKRNGFCYLSSTSSSSIFFFLLCLYTLITTIAATQATMKIITVTGLEFPLDMIFAALYYSKASRKSSQNYGIIAQLGEHLPYKQGVTGSSPVGPIYMAE